MKAKGSSWRTPDFHKATPSRAPERHGFSIHSKLKRPVRSWNLASGQIKEKGNCTVSIMSQASCKFLVHIISLNIHNNPLNLITPRYSSFIVEMAFWYIRSNREIKQILSGVVRPHTNLLTSQSLISKTRIIILTQKG